MYESGSESEGECDDGSVDEEVDVSKPQLMDPSVSEERKDYEHEPTSVFTPGNNAHATTFTPATPSTVISDSGAVMLYLRLDCGPVAFDHLAESGLTVRLSHFGCVIRGPDGLKHRGT